MATQPTSAGAKLYQPVAVDSLYALLDRLPDPDLILQKLGLHRADLRRLETDDEIAGAMDTRRDAVTSTPWRLEPYVEAQHKWLWEALAPHMDTLLTAAWQAVPYGYSVAEVVLKPGTDITIDHVGEKPMQWFEPLREGGLNMTLPMQGLPIKVPTDGKFILTRRLPTYENPFGVSLLSRCYWPWFFRHNGWEFRMKFLGRFADPLLLGSVQDPKAWVELMQGLGFTSLIGVGKDEKVAPVSGGDKDAFEQVENALVARIQKTWLGQTLTTQMSASGGSYAAAQVHNEVRKDKRDADLKLVEPAGQTLVNLLWKVNNRPGLPPTFRLQDPKGLDSERATRDATLVNAKILKFTEDYIQTRYDLEPGDFTVPEEAPATMIPGLPGQAALKLALREGQRFSKDQAMLERLMEEGKVIAPQQPIPGELVKKAILAATSPEDLSKRLAALYRDHDPVVFAEALERALFAADVLGYATSEKRIGIESGA